MSVKRLAVGPRTDTRMLYLVGAPASGKSTTLLRVLELMGAELVGPERTLHPGHRGVLKGMAIESVLDSSELGVYLGNLGTKKRGSGFPGTDGLSMAAPPVAVEWLEEGTLPPLIVGEGARLSGDKVVQAMARNTRLVLAYLFADPADLDARCEARGSDQAETFRRAAATRAWRAAQAAHDAGAHVIVADTSQMGVEDIARKLLGAISR